MSYTEYRDIAVNARGKVKTRRALVRVYEPDDPCPAELCDRGYVTTTTGMRGEGTVTLPCVSCKGTGRRDLDWFGTVEILKYVNV